MGNGDFIFVSDSVQLPQRVIVADASLVEKRYAICKECESLQDGRCSACGCPIPGRLKVSISSCPLGKWDAVGVAGLMAKPASVTDMAKGFFGSAGKFVAAGMPRTPSDVFQARLDTCRSCAYWNAEGFAGTGSCRQCGCSTQAKLRMATSECPMGYWHAVPGNKG